MRDHCGEGGNLPNATAAFVLRGAARGMTRPRAVWGRPWVVNGRMPVSMRSRFTRVALFTCLHATITFGLGIYGMMGSSARFDGFRPPPGSALAGKVAEIFMLPGFLLWTTWASRNLSNAVEWLLLLGNSALWGLVLSAWYERARSRYKRPKGEM